MHLHLCGVLKEKSAGRDGEFQWTRPARFVTSAAHGYGTVAETWLESALSTPLELTELTT